VALAQVSKSGETKIKGSTTSVLPFTGPNLNDVIVDSQMVMNGSSSGSTVLDIYLNCFGTNLRAVPNPISSTSQITATIYYLTAAGTKRKLDLTFPATATMTNPSMAITNLTNNTVVDNNSTNRLTAILRGNLIRVVLTGARTIPVDVAATGTDFSKLESLAIKSDFLSDISFAQTVTSAPGQFMAFSGPVTASNSWYVADNGKAVTLLASFPGENGFCGGYFSPLVLKFDDELPVVDHKSNFKLVKNQGKNKIAWPSFKSEMYFLALDLDKNGKVDGGHELFGDINNFPNGFKNLEIYDLNHDGVIDEKDPVFKKLILWRDVNHDGKSSAKEIKTLKEMGVQSISLDFDKVSQDLTADASVLGPGKFTYKDKNGTEKKGRVWDIFLKIVP
jgi:hypothetical protein